VTHNRNNTKAKEAAMQLRVSVVMTVSVVALALLLASASFVCGTNTPEQELDFLRAKVRQYYPRMAPEKAEAFAKAILSIAEQQAFIDLHHPASPATSELNCTTLLVVARACGA
jgi:hypothetical protein